MISVAIHLFKHYKENKPLDIYQIQNQIQSIEKNLNRVSKAVELQIKNIKPNEHTNLRNYLFKNIQAELKENYALTICNKRNELLFWTNNNIPLDQKINEIIETDKQIIHLENGWYLINKTVYKQFVIVSFYYLKSEYFYENSYLESEFTFQLPGDFLISKKPVERGFDIYTKDNTYLLTLIPPLDKKEDKQNNNILQVLFFISALIFLLLFCNSLIQIYSKDKVSLVSILISIIVFVFLISIIVFRLPGFLHDSHLYGISQTKLLGFPLYVGDLFLISVYILFVSYNFFRILPFQKLLNIKNKKIIVVFSILFILIIFFCFNFFSKLTHSIIIDYNITFDIQKSFSENITSLISHIIIGILFTSFVYLSDHFISLLKRITSLKNLSIATMPAIIILVSLEYLELIDFNIIILISFLIITWIIILIRFYQKKYSFYAVISLSFSITVFLVVFESQVQQKKEHEIEYALIRSLANERDQMAERFLTEIHERLSSDTTLVSMIRDINLEQDLLLPEYLKRKYFYGFWEKYDLEIVLCGNSELYRKENQAANCEGYFSLLFEESGENITNTNFYFIRNKSGKITYTGAIKIPEHIDDRKLALYLTLSEKLVTKTLGYPKLLIDKSADFESLYDDYSYAKYTNGVLAVKSGKFQYDLTDNSFETENKKTYVEFGLHRHLIYETGTGQKIILSKEAIRLYDRIITFAYLFVFYNLLIFISILIVNRKFILKKLNLDFKNQIRFSMVFVLLISFFLFGAGTIYYALRENKRVNNKEMTDKVQSVLIELTHKLDQVDNLTPSWHTDKYDHLDELLIKFSQVFFSDINLYDLNGKLLATSRSEIFNRGLTGKQMNSNAYKMMSILKKTEYIQKENIGNLEFSSIYIPLKNDRNKIIAYINLPYFAKNDSLQRNLSNVLIATINLYVVLFLLTAFLAFFISIEITRPLRMLRSKFKALQLGAKHQEIIYTKNDEIGELVKEYNEMVNKLEISAKKLAESERESAWREMAKQIAHEIKNPLTPMKLSIQLLQKTWYDGPEKNDEFENRLNNVSETLIEQINTLSSIASEFSTFAKMPKARNEEVLIAKKLKTVTGLFENTKNIKLELELNNNEDVRIIADKEQVSRVFINLIKNSVQAIPPKKEGKIKIELTEKENTAIISIEDNGNGIPEERKERLFEPSFTTKTTGMGIGLAIVKNIVNSAGGDIWFESDLGKGTKFFVEFLKV